MKMQFTSKSLVDVSWEVIKPRYHGTGECPFYIEDAVTKFLIAPLAEISHLTKLEFYFRTNQDNENKSLIDDAGLVVLANGLLSQNYHHENFEISFNVFAQTENSISKTIAFCNMLQEVFSKENKLEGLNLTINNFNAEELNKLGMAINSDHAPVGLKLKLNNFFPESYRWTDNQKKYDPDFQNFYSLKSMLETGKCPKNFSLDFDQTVIPEKGVLLFAEMLESGKCPEGFSINFKKAFII